jgi:hypothetical protein
MNGHNDKFRTVIRRTLRDTLCFSQEHSQEWAENADYFVDWAAVQACFKLGWSGVAATVPPPHTGGIPFLAGAGGVFALNEKGIRRFVRHKPEVIAKKLMGKITGHLSKKLKISQKLEKSFPKMKWLWDRL